MKNPPVNSPQVSPVVALLLIAATWLMLYVVSATAPFHLMDNDQQRPAAYVMDMLLNGNWWVQDDITRDVTSKPPLLTWLTGLVMLGTGVVNAWTLYLVGALSVLGMALLAWYVGRRWLGDWVGMAAALTWLLSGVALKHCGLARTDALFSVLTFGALVAMIPAARTGRGWIWVWVLVTLATATKGPLGLVLVALAVPALWWENHTRDADDPGARLLSLGPWRVHLAGLLLFLGVAGGWLGVAWLLEGQRVIDKIIGRELVGHVVMSQSSQKGMFSSVLNPLGYLVSRSLPWIVLVFPALWRLVWPGAATLAPGRRFVLRLMACYLVLGLAMFSAGAHQRPDHLVPLLPAAHLLVAWELARWWRPAVDRRFLAGYAGVLAVFALVTLLVFQVFQPLGRVSKHSIWAARMAERIESTVGPNFPIVMVDLPYATQFRLRTYRQQVPSFVGYHLLWDNEYAVYVGVRDFRPFPDRPGQHVVLEVPPSGPDQEAYLRIYSNRETFEYHDKMAMTANGVVVRMENLRPTMAGDRHLTFVRTGGPDGASPSALRFLNVSYELRRLTVQVDQGLIHDIALDPGGERLLTFSPPR